jgi:serine/threonine protein kinase
MQELREGTPLQGGKYIIKRVLGQGGFGITYLAEQVSLGREVAIKEFFMKDGCLRERATGFVTVPTTGAAARVEQFRKKFFKEARTLAGLDHPHIVSVIDVFEENGTVYYSMPYMPNGSLKSLVKSRGRLSETEALRYVGQVASALQYMHTEHLCHYDVKPDNILLDSRVNAVLIDFGISKNYDSEGNETSTTPIGISEGYAPIEQYQGISDFSPASDVYALGATLYYLLEGKTPPSAISRVQGNELSFNEDISAHTQSLINESMKLSVT